MTSRWRAASRVAVSLLSLALARSALAQQSGAPAPTPAAEAKVRVKLVTGDSYEGRLVSLRKDSLVVAWAEGGVGTLARTSVASIEVGSGSHRPVARGATIGAVVGFFAGTLTGAGLYSPPCNFQEPAPCDLDRGSRTGAAAEGAYRGAALGLLVGAAQGLVPRERWVPMSLGVAPRVGLGVLPNGPIVLTARATF
jgi:hypothetical protein